jgi:hypothetical protein
MVVVAKHRGYTAPSILARFLLSQETIIGIVIIIAVGFDLLRQSRMKSS